MSILFLNCQSQISDSSVIDKADVPDIETESETEIDSEAEEETGSENIAAEGSGEDDEGIVSEEEVSVGIPFGFWGLNGFHDEEGLLDVQARFGVTVFQVAAGSPSYSVGTLLEDARNAGMKVTLRMTSSPDYSGSFDVDAWKAELDDWIGSGVDEFIEDGTLVGHMLLDDIYNFAGTDPTAEDLEEIAEYSKTLFPDLFVFVRERASNAPIPFSGAYEYVDAFVNQFTTVDIDNGEVSDFDGDGDIDVDDYALENADAAESLGVGIIMGLNLCDGGNGESGQTGWRAPTGSRTFYAMSANEILTYGTALLDVPNVLMFLMWEYDGEEVWYSDGTTVGSGYFDETGRQDALYELSQIAAEY